MTDPKKSVEAESAKSWCFEEARALRSRLGGKIPAKGYVLFETGYGPSGLPHIGTFGEVARTTMVRRAFEVLTGFPTRLFAFSDDMDGLRKVPENVPNREKLAEFIGMPLTKVPDPFEKFESFAHHNNARLRSFLDAYGFEYEFKSSTECYRSGVFDQTLNEVLVSYDAIMKIMLPTLGPDRRATYCPFLPISPKTGRVLQVPAEEIKQDTKTIIFADEDGTFFETPVTGGACKLQWKPDWAMRWKALDVDFEPAGKDLTDSVKLGEKIVRALGGTPPAGFIYELFLDGNGEKISKSRGNGLSIEEWLTYASPESLALYMYQQPKRAKKLSFDVIPKATDEYLTFLQKYSEQTPAERLENPVYHIHGANPPDHFSPVSFSLLLNLVGAAGAEDKETLFGFVKKYAPEAQGKSSVLIERMIDYALVYYRDFILPNKKYRTPSEAERAALLQLKARFSALDENTPEDVIQTEIFTVGKEAGYENLREWFGVLYEILLGQTQGPRMGSFVALYGLKRFCAMLDAALVKS